MSTVQKLKHFVGTFKTTAPVAVHNTKLDKNAGNFFSSCTKFGNVSQLCDPTGTLTGKIRMTLFLTTHYVTVGVVKGFQQVLICLR